ncbi:MAG: Uma2 family endonuclease [Acidobacteriaceae bacterium]|nr:Uma2 family endonuclease [Acidobacteriaceae bacterium]MBV9035803.1 Uma2 family endonuclease [Acidobacteriaceae bacterium]MBV9224632.1 Uma2 family endonuclease [Acidobacteriaceae bacterium]MBV9678306.1 Uma2 family endonuclease [Acidobacteriaceae bacterium]
MATQVTPHKISFDQYLELERSATGKSEYRGGELFLMAGGTAAHARLSARIIGLLERTLPRSCQVFTSDLKLYAAAVDEGMYPDASFLCGEPEFYQGQKDVLLNPTVVFEVLSPSTREYDLSLKASFYRSIPALEALILIDSERMYVQRQARQATGWTLEEWTDHEGMLPITGSLSFSLRELYDQIL